MSGQLDYAAIRRQIPIRRVLELLNWEPATRRGARWRGPCLFCQPLPGRTRDRSSDDRSSCDRSSSRPRKEHSFSVEAQRNLFHCFRCQGGGNQLDLWSAATGKPLYTATLDLCRRLGVTPISQANPQPKNRA